MPARGTLGRSHVLLLLLLVSAHLPSVKPLANAEGDEGVADSVGLLTTFLNHHMFGEHALTFDNASGAYSTTSPESKVMCNLRIGPHSKGLFERFLRLFPQFEVIVFDTDFQDPDFGFGYFQRIDAEFPDRVMHSVLEGYGGVCDFLVTSLDVPFFTFRSVEDRYACEFLISNWQKTFCGMGPDGFQGCEGSLCMCFAMTHSLMDPMYVPVNCTGFKEVQYESFHGTSQWHQDWFLYHNFLKHLPPREDGFYVDIGAYDPFLISNTVTLEQCFGWDGVCVEPNPQLVHGLRAYRSCQVYPVCIWNHNVGKTFQHSIEAELAEVVADSDEAAPDEYFNPKEAFGSNSSSARVFNSTCYSLHDFLVGAGLHGRRIDFLSVDVEHGEVEVFEAFPFEDWDIRMIVVETNRDTSFAVDVLMLSNAYTKVALMGKDAVYAHHRFVAEVAAARGTWSLDFPVEMQRYEEPYRDFQRRFLTGDFKGKDAHF